MRVVQRAVRHPSVVSANAARKLSGDHSDGADQEKKAESLSPPHSDDDASTPETSGFTLEMLREEVEQDLVAGEHDTAYDSMSTSIVMRL